MPKRYDDLPLKEVKELLEKLPPNLKIRVYHDIKEEQGESMKPPRKKNTISERVGRLETKVDQLFITVDQLAKTVSQLITTVNNLAKEMKNGFKQVNSRIDKIDSRLDYIVKANKLKDLPKSK